MSRHTGEGNVRFCRSQEVLRTANDLTDVIGLETNMHTEDFVNTDHSTGLFHRHGTANAFFSGLENKADLALELITHGSNNFCQSQADSNVTVVTASMHSALIDRGKTFDIGAMVGVSAFGHIVAVHVKTHSKERTFTAKVHIGPETGHTTFHLGHQFRISALSNGTFHMSLEGVGRGHTHHGFTADCLFTHRNGITQLLHLFDSHRGRAEFRPTGFRMLMQVTANLSKIGDKFFNFFLKILIHLCSSLVAKKCELPTSYFN